jgi:hypothetical protein
MLNLNERRYRQVSAPAGVPSLEVYVGRKHLASAGRLLGVGDSIGQAGRSHPGEQHFSRSAHQFVYSVIAGFTEKLFPLIIGAHGWSKT